MDREIVSPKDVRLIDTLKHIGNDRLFKYNKSHFPLSKVIEFYRGNAPNLMSNMVGLEFEVYLLFDYLVKLGAKDIETEVLIQTPIGKTFADAVCTINNEKHYYEAKCQVKLRKKAATQVRKAKGIYKNCHVLIPSNCYVPRSVRRDIERAGGTIDKAPISKEDIVQRLLTLQKLIKRV